jgi:hypothetical protein
MNDLWYANLSLGGPLPKTGVGLGNSGASDFVSLGRWGLLGLLVGANNAHNHGP